MYRFVSSHALDRDLCGRNECTQQHRPYPLARGSSKSAGEGKGPGHNPRHKIFPRHEFLRITNEFCGNPLSEDVPPKSLQGILDISLGSINLARVWFVQEPIEPAYGSVWVVGVH